MLRLPAVGRALAGAAHSKGQLVTSGNGKTTHLSENTNKHKIKIRNSVSMYGLKASDRFVVLILCIFALPLFSKFTKELDREQNFPIVKG